MFESFELFKKVSGEHKFSKMKNFQGKLKSFSSKRILYFDYALLISTKIMNVFQMRIVFKF